jgi:hypothetical protein
MLAGAANMDGSVHRSALVACASWRCPFPTLARVPACTGARLISDLAVSCSSGGGFSYGRVQGCMGIARGIEHMDPSRAVAGSAAAGEAAPRRRRCFVLHVPTWGSEGHGICVRPPGRERDASGGGEGGEGGGEGGQGGGGRGSGDGRGGRGAASIAGRPGALAPRRPCCCRLAAGNPASRPHASLRDPWSKIAQRHLE